VSDIISRVGLGDFGPLHRALSTNHYMEVKFFFSVDSKTHWVFWWFEQLSSTIGWRVI